MGTDGGMGTGGETALVTTKLTPPTLPGQLVDRARLSGLLDEAADDPVVRVVLVSAPAGSGKSTLVADWQQRHGGAWLQADRADHDPARFWGHVVGALTKLVPDVRTAAGSAVPSAGGDAEPLLGRIANVLSTAGPVVLVIDDFHLVSNPTIDDGLERLIELAPPSFLLILSTRLDPSLRLSRLRVRSQLVEIRADTLRFAADEAQLLLDDGRITDPHVAALCERTEGWAAGLVLAGLSLSGSDDHDTFVAAFQGDDRLVVDYLTDEFLAGIDDADRQRMLQTAILDRMCGPLIDTICETTDGARWLRETAGANQLLISLDSTGTWFRYHHLLQDVLRLEAEQATVDTAGAHGRAARWHREHGSPHDAVEHFIAAGAHEDAADLIYDEATELMNQGQLRTVADQVARLGPLADEHCGTTVVQGYISLLTGRFAEAHHRIERARTLHPDGDKAGLIAALAIMTHLGTGNVAAALDEARAAAAPFESTQAMTLGGAHVWAGAFDSARPLLDQADRMAPDEGHAFVQVMSPILSGIADIETGATDAARTAAERSIDLAERLGLSELTQTALAHSLLARTIDDPASAIESARRGVDLGRRSPERITSAYALACAGDVLAHHGEPEGPDLIIEARSIIDRCSDPGIAGRYLARVEARHRIEAPTQPTADLVDDLTDRELAVLRYLPSAMSQRDIASELYVSLNTVKTHCKAIYRKLAVGDRKAAVQAARDAGLL